MCRWVAGGSGRRPADPGAGRIVTRVPVFAAMAEPYDYVRSRGQHRLASEQAGNQEVLRDQGRRNALLRGHATQARLATVRGPVRRVHIPALPGNRFAAAQAEQVPAAG